MKHVVGHYADKCFIRRMGTYIFRKRKTQKTRLLPKQREDGYCAAVPRLLRGHLMDHRGKHPPARRFLFPSLSLPIPLLSPLFTGIVIAIYVGNNRPATVPCRKKEKGGTFQISFIGGTVDRHELPTQQDL